MYAVFQCLKDSKPLAVKIPNFDKTGQPLLFFPNFKEAKPDFSLISIGCFLSKIKGITHYKDTVFIGFETKESYLHNYLVIDNTVRIITTDDFNK
jgi:hypothetical protein